MTPETVGTAFFDPWIDLDYYYTLLPHFPLIFDRVFVYYPSDRWIDKTSYLNPIAKPRYRQNLLYWLSEGVLVPVVKGDYPFNEHIGGRRLENDGPSEDFRKALAEMRGAREATWVILNRDATERGRQSASKIIDKLGGSEEAAQSLRVSVDRTAVPELAYHYAGGNDASVAQTLIETIGTYENDDWIRHDRKLGEYVLPPVKAYQYRALQDLLKYPQHRDIFHQVALAAVDQYTAARQYRTGLEWLDRDKLKEWRDLGLHRILRTWLLVEASKFEEGTADAAAIAGSVVAQSLENLREQIPVKLAAALLDAGLLWSVIGACIGFFTSGVVGGAVGYVGGKAVGKVGEKSVRITTTKMCCSRLVDLVANALGGKTTNAVERFRLGFGEVTVFGTDER